MADISVDDLLATAKRWEQNLKKELDKETREDAEYLKTKIYEHFDEVSDTPVIGYRLEGAGSVYPIPKTTAIKIQYKKKWQKPNVDIKWAKNGAQLNIIGTDAKILEYGLSPNTLPSDWWIMDDYQGYYDARNYTGQGNWYEAIRLTTGNEDPLISIGEKGGRFFAHHSIPTMFVRKACKEYENAVKNNDTSVHLSANGIKVMLEKELHK